MKKCYYYIPSYEELKQLDTNYEYDYEVFDLCGSARLRIYYNEDENKKISVDYLENGYLHDIGLPIRHKTKIIEGKFYNLNKKNYQAIIKFIQLVKEAILEELHKWE